MLGKLKRELNSREMPLRGTSIEGPANELGDQGVVEITGNQLRLLALQVDNVIIYCLLSAIDIWHGSTF